MRCGCVSEVRRSLRVIYHFRWGLMNPSKLDSNLIVVDLIEKEEASFETLTEGVFIEHRQILFALCRWQKSCFWLLWFNTIFILYPVESGASKPTSSFSHWHCPSCLPLPGEEPRFPQVQIHHWLPIPSSWVQATVPRNAWMVVSALLASTVCLFTILFPSRSSVRKIKIIWHHWNSLYTVRESAASQN